MRIIALTHSTRKIQPFSVLNIVCSVCLTNDCDVCTDLFKSHGLNAVETNQVCGHCLCVAHNEFSRVEQRFSKWDLSPPSNYYHVLLLLRKSGMFVNVSECKR